MTDVERTVWMGLLAQHRPTTPEQWARLLTTWERWRYEQGMDERV